MIVLELDQVEIDHCLSCKGIWLDAGELELLLKDADSGKAFLTAFKSAGPVAEKQRRCPICRKKMEKVNFAGDPPVLIDRCRREHGLWFDEGELNRIILPASGERGSVAGLLKDMFGKNIDGEIRNSPENTE